MYPCVSGLISDTKRERDTGGNDRSRWGKILSQSVARREGKRGVEHEMCIFRFQFLCHSLPKSQGKDNNNNIKRSANKHTYTNNTHTQTTHTQTHVDHA